MQKIKIDVSSILDRFDCPICMCKMQDPCITKCGHTFCKECIAEQVNRKHECPLCMMEIKAQEDIIRNYSLETLIKQIEQKQDQEAKEYFDSLAGK